MPTLRSTDINQFLLRRQENWKRLEILVSIAEAQGLSRFSAEEVREFGILYRRVSSDLVTARAKTANAEILEYLNDLVARAYSQVYRARRFRPQDIITFFTVDFPRLFRHSSKYLAIAAALLLAATTFGWHLNQYDPAGAYYMLPPGLVKQIPQMREMWRGQTGHAVDFNLMSITSSWLMTHNIGIGLVAFSGGILLGLPTLWAMVQNGLMLGILGEAMSRPDTALVFWSLILPHGVIELSAIVVMGASGFMIAGALLAPGQRSRRDALVERGRLAVLLALGGAVMLVIAGLIEGFITPPAFIPPWAKLLFAAFTLVGEVYYFALAGRGPKKGLIQNLLTTESEASSIPDL